MHILRDFSFNGHGTPIPKTQYRHRLQALLITWLGVVSLDEFMKIFS